MIETSSSPQRNALSFHEYELEDGTIYPQFDAGEPDVQWNTNGNHVPSHDMKSGVNLDSEYAAPEQVNKYRYVFFEWLIKFVRMNAPVQNVDLSSFPSSVTVNWIFQTS